MNQFDNRNQEPENSDSRYENILRNTLMKRTGRNFQRNVDRAIVPKNNEKLDHAEVANQIFDNILSRRNSPKPSEPAAPVYHRDDQHPTEVGPSYGDILDEILWPDEKPMAPPIEQITLAENNTFALDQTLQQPLDLERTLQHPASLDKTLQQPQFPSSAGHRAAKPQAPAIPRSANPQPPAPPQPSQPEASAANPYQHLLSRTLNMRVKQIEAAMGIYEEADVQEASQDYASALDEVLGLDGVDLSYDKDQGSLSQTLYQKQLDNILWPSQQGPSQTQIERPPVDEGKIRCVMAQYLQSLIHLDPYNLITVQRQVMDEKFSAFWIRHFMQELRFLLQTIETEFAIYVFMNQIDLIKPLITVEFTERFRLIIEKMLPQKKAGNLFSHTTNNNDQRLVFDRMSNNTFEDVRRILKNYHKSFSPEDSFHLFSFLRIKLPEFLKQKREELMVLLQTRNEESVPDPFTGGFLAYLFFSEAFEHHFQLLQEDEKNYNRLFQSFLREKAEKVGDREDRLIQVALMCMDLYHEKAAYFKEEERQTLNQALTLIETQLRFVLDPSFDKESFLENLQEIFEARTQSQYHVEAQSLQNLGVEINQLARQGGSDAHIRINHLNAMYERHQQEMSALYHKRKDTLNKVLNNEGPGGIKRSRKQFISKKIQACKSYLQRKMSLKFPPIQIPYREYQPAFLEQKRKEITEQFSWDNEFEEEVLGLAFQKANLILKSINESKSTVQFNLKLIFDGEPQQEQFLSAIQMFQADFEQVYHFADPELVAYLTQVLGPYFEGLRFPQHAEPLEMTARERTSYIAAYLGHNQHIKLLINQQYQQLIYDFRTLFDLTHALCMLELLQSQIQVEFAELFRQALFPAWECLAQSCLMVGKGQFHFVANPVALHDYSWQPPLTGFGVGVGSLDDDFELLSMGGEEEDFPALPAPAVGARKEKAPAASFRYQALPSAVLDEYEDEVDDEEQQPAYPAIPATPQRRLPLAPGRFEIYGAPTQQRRALPAAPSVESIVEDDFYKIMSQTQAEAPTPPVASPPQAPASESFYRPRGVESETTPPEPPPATAPPGKRERKRWLEITPVPNEQQNYNDMLDSIIGNFDGPPPKR